LKRFHQDLKATIIYVTHDQLEAVTMADKMAVMNGGYLQQYDAPDAIFNRPVNTFVATFVGSPAMNLVRGQVQSQNGSVHVQSPEGWGFPLSTVNSHRALASSGEVLLGLRHNAIRLRHDQQPGAVPAQVYTVEPTGDITFVHAMLGSGMLVLSVPPTTSVRPDDNVWLEFDQDHMHLFDGTTELALPA
jgi:multiple sugar transport system ATP-binding protein